ncbi:MAG: MATE family efflux transporter [Candidatus Onthomonas sp.]
MSRKQATTDLTVGSPIVQILLFSLPLVLGTLFQQLYSFADTVIVGRCIGKEALGAVGATYSLSFLTLGFVQGFCVGLGIPLSQSFGAKEPKKLHRYLWTGCWLCLAVSLILAIGMTSGADPLLRLMNTPAEMQGQAATYIQIIFLGIPSSVLYNYSASALRAVGDSKHPFQFLLFSSLLNIVLDYVFIVPFGMGVAGAAIATVLSQLVSGLLNTWQLLTRTQIIRIRREELRFSPPHARRLCTIAFPMGFEYSVSAIGALLLQNAINLLGAVAVTAQTTGEKIRQMFTLPMESVGMAMATYAGQNYGAKRMDRVKAGLRNGMVIQAVYCAVIWVVLYFVKTPLVGLVLGETVSAEAAGAVQYLGIISIFFLFHGTLMIFRNTLQGLGYSFQAVLSGICELAGRGLGSWLAVYSSSFVFIALANPFAFIFAGLYCIIMVAHYIRKIEREGFHRI